MLPIEKYIDVIENKDYEGLGNLFTKDGHIRRLTVRPK